MKILIKTFLLLIAFINGLQAQTYFNKRYNNFNSSALSVIESDSGGYLFPNIVQSPANILLINRLDANGDTLFAKRYSNPWQYYMLGASNSIIKTFDHNYVLSGAIKDSLSNVDAMLIKLNDNCDTLWTKRYGGPNWDVATAVFQTSDSGFVLMGGTESFSTGPYSDFYLIKTDKNGNFQWQKNYGNSSSEVCASGQITLDGGFIFSGQRNNMFYIVKTDNNGNFQWEKFYSGTAGPSFIKQLSDSTYILVGAKAIAGLGYEGLLSKLTKTGTVIWEKTFGGLHDQEFYAAPIILNDGSIICSGFGEIATGFAWGLLVKTDSSGNQKWYRTYYDMSTSIDDNFYDIKQTSDNGFIMSGTTQDAWLVKVDSNGCEIANCNVGIKEFEIADNKLLIYPNPASAEINILLEGDELSNYEISIINILGEVQKIEKSQSIISISEFSPGIYFAIAISKDGKQRLSQKFIIE